MSINLKIAFKIISLVCFIIILFSCNQEQKPAPESQAESLVRLEASHPDLLLADSLFAKGQALFQKSQYDSSKMSYEKAAILYEKHAFETDSLESWKKQFLARFQIAVILYQLGKSNETIQTGKVLLEHGLAKFGKMSAEVARAYDLLGVVYWQKALYDTAMFYQRETLPIRLQLFGEIHEEVAKSYHNLGLIYQYTGKLDSALAVYKKALEIRLKTIGENHLHTAASYNNIGLTYHDKSDYDNAMAAYEKALEIFQRLENNWFTQEVLNNIAIIHREKGDFNKTIEIYQYVFDVLIPIVGQNHSHVARTHLNIATAYMGKREYKKAESHLNRALEIWRSTIGEYHPTVSVVYMNLGNIYQEEHKDFEKAMTFYQTALNIRLTTLGGKHHEVAEMYHNIGNTYKLKGDLEKAISHYLKALDIFEDAYGQKHMAIGETYKNLGDAYLQQGKFDNAFSSYQKSLKALVYDFEDDNFMINPRLENIVSDNQLIWTLHSKARAFVLRRDQQNKISEKVADLEMALETYDLCIKLLDQKRRSYKTESARFLLAKYALQVYEEALLTALELQKLTGKRDFVERAFTIAEKSKNGALFQAVQEAGARRFSDLPDSLLEKERQLRIDLTYYNTQLEVMHQNQQNQDSLKMKQLRTQLFTLNQQYKALQSQFEKDYPKYYALKYDVLTVTVPAVQNALDEQTVIVEYFAGDSTSYIFTVEKNDLDIMEIQKASHFEEKVRTLRSLLSHPDSLRDERYLNIAYELYEGLLKPVEQKIAGKNVLIIPDGVLNYLPFEALLTKKVQPDTIDYREMPFLIKQNATSYAYSTSLWLETRQQVSEQPKNDFLAFAPIFPNGIASETRGAGLFNTHFSRNWTRAGTGHLPDSRNEVNGIKNLFQTSWYDRLFGSGVRVFLEDEASEKRVKSEKLRDYKYVHFSTHGLADEAAPDLSWLLFLDDSNSNEDGVLHLGEIYNLELDADLVVLSACETATGKLARGEGLLGLSRGFTYAGARNLLVSHWQVNDASTKNLMIGFYQNMLAGMPKAEALQKAKLDMIKSNATYAKPYHWAPFVLIGQ